MRGTVSKGKGCFDRCGKIRYCVRLLHALVVIYCCCISLIDVVVIKYFDKG